MGLNFASTDYELLDLNKVFNLSLRNSRVKKVSRAFSTVPGSKDVVFGIQAIVTSCHI